VLRLRESLHYNAEKSECKHYRRSMLSGMRLNASGNSASSAVLYPILLRPRSGHAA